MNVQVRGLHQKGNVDMDHGVKIATDDVESAFHGALSCWMIMVLGVCERPRQRPRTGGQAPSAEP